eukprot:8470119-Lingulodinium_polyedra.AAC.1
MLAESAVRQIPLANSRCQGTEVVPTVARMKRTFTILRARERSEWGFRSRLEGDSKTTSKETRAFP